MTVDISLVLGGQDIVAQAQELSSFPHFVIATPGRVVDHLENGAEDVRKSFKNLKYLIIDEADRIVNEECFQEDLKVICENVPGERTTYMFSATQLKGVEERKELFEGNDIQKKSEEVKLQKEISVFDCTEGFEKTIEGLSQ